MIYSPPQYKTSVEDVNKTLLDLKGELEDDVARITLIKFLYRNLGFTVQMLTGIILDPDQIITLKGMLQSNYTLCIWSRGGGKTFLCAVYCILQTIFFPNSNIIVCGPVFRSSRFIFNKIIELAEGKDAALLMQALGTVARRNDEFKVSINGGGIVSIPLSGDRVRGYRANILVVDEMLQMSQEIIERVLMPFLVVPQNLTERQIIRAKEDELIKRGVLKEEERMQFPNNAKFIGLSSASFQCEYLFKKYEEYVSQIYSPDLKEDGPRYFISQLAWSAFPEHRMDKEIIRLAQSDESNTASFKREYCSIFTDDSDSYFSLTKMLACTVPNGESPTLLLQGDKGKRYIMGIDPNASNSDSSDNFAICVIELDDDKIKEGKVGGTVVHNYAKAGEDLKSHVGYFYYLWTHFNIELIIIDNSGSTFFEVCNQSELFRKANLEIKLMEFSAEKEGAELEQQLKAARRNFNKQINRVAFTQVFTADAIRKMNEHLQGCIDYKKIWFGSPMKASEASFNQAAATQIPKDLVGEDSIGDLIDTQEVLIKQVRYESAAIEVKTTAKGTQSFDLPQAFRRNLSSSRVRKDSYTALLLACWCMKQYVDIFNVPIDNNSTFEPMLL
jgi:hypothetical protein